MGRQDGGVGACAPLRYSLLRFQVSVDDPQAVQVVQGQGQLSQVELDVLLREHHLVTARGPGRSAGLRRPRRPRPALLAPDTGGRGPATAPRPCSPGRPAKTARGPRERAPGAAPTPGPPAPAVTRLRGACLGLRLSTSASGVNPLDFCTPRSRTPRAHEALHGERLAPAPPSSALPSPPRVRANRPRPPHDTHAGQCLGVPGAPGGWSDVWAQGHPDSGELDHTDFEVTASRRRYPVPAGREQQHRLVWPPQQAARWSSGTIVTFATRNGRHGASKPSVLSHENPQQAPGKRGLEGAARGPDGGRVRSTLPVGPGATARSPGAIGGPLPHLPRPAGAFPGWMLLF